MFELSPQTPWIGPYEPPQVERPVITTALADIHRATNQLCGYFSYYRVLSPTWFVGPICALMTLSSDGSTSGDELVELFGPQAKNLRLAQMDASDEQNVTSLLGSLELLLYGQESPRSWEEYDNNPAFYPTYKKMAWCLSEEMDLFEDCVRGLKSTLGSVIQGACVYHERSRTLIPVVCEKAIVVTVDHALFDDDRQLAAEAVRLAQAYRESAGDDLPELSQVAFYSRCLDKPYPSSELRKGRVEVKMVDTALL